MSNSKRGRGRPQLYGDGMVAMKVPVAYKSIIKSLINHLNDTKDIDKSYRKSVSEPVFFRSLEDKAQSISFTTSPFKHEKQEEQLDLIDHINEKEMDS